MSEQHYQTENYNQINLNAIKNTKLFQKFMQNKSGLIVNNNNANKQTEIKIQQKKQQIVHFGNKKWNDNIKNQEALIKTSQREQNSFKNLKNIEKRQQKSLNAQKNQYNSYEGKYNGYEDINEQKQGQYFALRQQIQNSHVQPYTEDNDEYKNSMNNIKYNQVYKANQGQKPLNQPKRKRNFNPYIETNKHNNDYRKSENNFNQEQARLNNYRTSNNNLQDSLDYSNQSNSNLKFQNYNRNNNYANSANLASENPSPLKSQLSTPVLNHQPVQHLSETLPITNLNQQQYRLKYQALSKKYQELKYELKNQNKFRKKQHNDWEHQTEVIKDKLFQVQSREDSLLIQNQRLKDKLQNQNLQKMKIQQESKELGYKIKQLQDQLSMKDNSAKQRADQINYWKSQTDSVKQEFNSLKLSFEKKSDQYNLLCGDYQIIKKERDNKNYLLQDLRNSISSLVQENSAAKDELFSLVTKLYQLQQENQMLKNDVKRQQMDTSHINYMRDRIQSTNLQRQERTQQTFKQQRNPQRNQLIKQPLRQSLVQQQKPLNEKQARRRGQFARQRGQLTRNQKPQRDQRSFIKENSHNMSVNQQRSHIQHFKPINGGNKAARIHEISEELQKIRDIKAMNGAIRRKKIDLERELQQLES